MKADVSLHAGAQQRVGMKGAEATAEKQTSCVNMEVGRPDCVEFSGHERGGGWGTTLTFKVRPHESGSALCCGLCGA